MNDDTRPSPATSPSEPFQPTPPVDPAFALPDPAGSGAQFSGRTRPKHEAVRAGIVIGTGLLVAIGAAVAMGASPAPNASSGTNPGASSQTTPGQRGSDRGWFDPIGGGGPGGGGPGRDFGGPGGHDGRGFGQISVTGISGSSVSLKTDDGWTRTITVAASTTITKGGQAAKLADVAIGDVVRFAESRNADGSFTITAIEIVVPRVAGTVTAVGSDSITINGRYGTSQTIRTTGSTTYHLGRSDGSRSDVKVGTTIVASGEKAADGTLSASSVTILLPRVAGVVSARTASTITISRRDGTSLTIHVSAATTYDVAGTSGAKLSDVTVGLGVIVEGSQRSDGSIDAIEVHAGSLRGGRGHDNGNNGPNASVAPGAAGGSQG